jgi:hypothetical protein
LEPEFGEHGDHLAHSLVTGDFGEWLGRPPVVAGERATGFLGYSSGDRAAGSEVAGEDVGKQLITRLMQGA